MVENTRSGADGYGQVREGMDVLDQNGDKIGKAGETLGGGRYFNVDAGFLGMKEYYVPFDAVTEVRDDAVYVNVTKDRLGTGPAPHTPKIACSSVGTTASTWAKVHSRGGLSGRQRRKLAPWRKRSPWRWSKATSHTSSGRSGS